MADPIEAQLTDYRNLGRLFGVQARADQLVAEQRAAVAEARRHRPTGEPPRLLWIYSAYDGQPYVAGKAGLASAMSRVFGAVNVFDDVDDKWPEVQWEQLAARNPDLIVVADLEERGRPGDAARELRANPATAQMVAVKEGRFLVVPGVEMDTSVRWTRALTQLRDELVRRGLVR
nr:ABC transporter substrate-binding protein [Arsenicicoccus sp. oral taxon 190]